MVKLKVQEVKRSKIKSLNIPKPDPDEAEDQIDSADESLDSDQELQLAFARKELTPGLNVIKNAPKEFINDEEGLNRKLKDIYLNMEWIERMDITTPKFNLPEADANGNVPSLVDNDFQRESLFLQQAQAAVQMSLPRLKGFGILTKRAEDYFAEMAKSDTHMKRVRSTLLTKHAEIEKSEKIRKQRELKKIGKSIQVENEQKKAKAKKTVYKSEKQFIEEGDKSTARRPKDDAKNKSGNKKKTFKEAKYGFGGRKKRSKYNTAESSADAFKSARSKGQGAKGGKAGKAPFKRPAGNKNKPKSSKKRTNKN